jgi:putative flippase GtrA
MSDIRRFAGFVAVGGINTVFGYAAFATALFIGLRPELAVVVSTIAGILFNFGSLGTLFGSHAARRFPRYLLTYGALLALNIILLKGLMAVHIHPLVGQGIAVILLAPLSFVMMRRFVFAEVRS